jgi:hypothetical protein
MFLLKIDSFLFRKPISLMDQVWSPALIVIAYNRPHSLARILGSLDRASYPEGRSVPLIISIDKGDNQEVLEVADRFIWAHGEKTIIHQPQNLGLKKHVLSCGDLSEKYGSVIVLEDDLFVSPHFYEFALQSLTYFHDMPGLAGISLYTHRANVHANNLPFLPLDDGQDVFFMQMPSSWGQIWTWAWWQPFRQWLSEHEALMPEERIPAFVRAWPASSWLKHKIRYLVAQDRFYVYPRYSLSTNFGDTGTNFTSNSTVYQVPLSFGARRWSLGPLDQSVAVYDAYFEWESDRPHRLMPDLEGQPVVMNCYGQKDLNQYGPETLVLVNSDKLLDKAKAAYGMEMRPFEMNLIEGIPGNQLQLIQNAALPDSLLTSAQVTRYFYDQIPLGTAMQLTRRQFESKVNHFLRQR